VINVCYQEQDGTKSDVQLRNPDDGQKGCPKHVES